MLKLAGIGAASVPASGGTLLPGSRSAHAANVSLTPLSPTSPLRYSWTIWTTSLSPMCGIKIVLATAADPRR